MPPNSVNSYALYSDEAVAMPLSDKDWKEIRRFVAKSAAQTAPISSAATTLGPTTAPADNWFRRNAYLFPIATPIITVMLFVIGIGFGWFNSVFDARVNSKLNEPNGINAQLSTLTSSVQTANGELNAIRRLWEAQLKKASELLPGQFKDSLAETANA